MTDQREKALPLNDSIAETSPGIPDEALGPGKELPEPPSDEEERKIREKLGAKLDEVDTLPLEGE
ncbi:MAG: hypothetical protein HOP96_11405 [Sphingomonas sp.]|nr:hypothetical protein [Sphingomonas sp.]